MASVRVRSGGSTQNTEVVAIDDEGEEHVLLGVVSIQWKAAMEPSERGGMEHALATAVIEFDMIETDVVGLAVDA